MRGERAGDTEVHSAVHKTSTGCRDDRRFPNDAVADGAGRDVPAPGANHGAELRLPRHGRARESPLYRLVEQHLEELLHLWSQRFARTHGPLRPVVERVLRGFLTCGIVQGRHGDVPCVEGPGRAD
jgi:hypothetical protein